MTDAATARPIGVFDSGVGGLTVLRALRERLPDESYVYLGDTARVPYGTKSARSITTYSLQATARLIEHDVKCLVVACNTASAVALEALGRQYASLPVLGVVEPGARAGCAASASGRIAVIGTESTVRGGAYERAITSLRPGASVVAAACPLFVALAEEGWTDGDIVEAIAHRYLDPLFATDTAVPDTLLLGCTHFPVLRTALERVVGASVRIVDSAVTAAEALVRLLDSRRLPAPANAATRQSRLRLLCTDDRERFARVGAVFLGEPLAPDSIEVVDLLGFEGPRPDRELRV